MAEYSFSQIEAKWQKKWEQTRIYQAEEPSQKPKYYALDMFPYPSGAGLHVGHPLGYIASDIIARYKRAKGFNVLHPMGFDSFGLPAEQYAIQTGKHPAATTTENISRYKEQLKNIGFSYDWSREIQTSQPEYYKWTQWIFAELFEAWYNKKTNKAEKIETLLAEFAQNGNTELQAASDEETPIFTAQEWKSFSEKQQSDRLLKYRLAYLADAYVNWCPALGTVLANDEVKEGVSERGGYPVERKLMRQWMMRISAYSERLLQDLHPLEWSESIKEIQRNWIGKSVGAEVTFQIQDSKQTITVFTTRIDTIFGVTYLVLAPENPLVSELVLHEQLGQVEAYIEKATNRSERDRMADVKTVSGVFTGRYALHPFTQTPIPIWVADYVLAGYGTGAVMGVPSSDDRDFRFATYFNLPIVRVIQGTEDLENPTEKKYGKMIHSGMLNGLDYEQAMEVAIDFAVAGGFGIKKINYKMRDAVFSRQRYWGEPVPIYFKNNLPALLHWSDLPLELPKIDKYLPTETGEPPLGRAENWKYQNEYEYELSTMPGWAGSSWYWLRYMDVANTERFVGKEKETYWQNVDLYVGGAEHATGHLLYSRFWNKVLYDLGHISQPEPFKKLINQGMIQGRSNFVYKILYKEQQAYHRLSEHILPLGFEMSATPGDLRVDFIHTTEKIAVEIRSHANISENWQEYLGKYAEILSSDTHVIFVSVEEVFSNVGEAVNRIKNALERKEFLQFPITEYKLPNLFVSHNLRHEYETLTLHVDVNIVRDEVLDIDAFRCWRDDLADAEFILENGKYICGYEVEKMSKRWHNVVNPDKIVERYGADTLRLYEMFLGPLEQFKPWNTHGIEGTSKFLRKFWRLFHNENNEFEVSKEPASPEELKILHATIKRTTEDIERFSFNTPVSGFMICVNELSELKCHKREILEPLSILLAPYAPHICEEVWHLLGNTESINRATYPVCNEIYLQENNFSYPVSINGKHRTNIEFALDMPKEEMEKLVLESQTVQKWLDGNLPKKMIIVTKKIINIVV